MAREVHERENLLRDAKALVQRVELKIDLSADSKITSAFWRAAATAAGVRLHRHISNMPASPSYAALSSPRQNTQFIYEPTLTDEAEIELRDPLKNQFATNLSDTIFAGFRLQGEMSVYFGNDPVYQFTRVGSLRRAFSHGQIIKAQQGQLFSWQRHRADHRVEMIQHKLNSHDQSQWLSAMCQRLLTLQSVLEKNAYQIVGQFPANGDVVNRLHQWLVAHHEIQVADRPGIC